MTILGLLICGLLFMAIQLWQGKWAFLISGYNTMSKEEKSQYDERVLCRHTSKILIGCCFGLGLVVLGLRVENIWLLPMGMSLILISTIVGSLFADIGKRLNKPDIPVKHLQQPQRGRYSVLDLGIIGTLIIGFTTLIISIAYRQPRITMAEDLLRIHALYGETIKLSDIGSVSLLGVSMKEIGIETRTNGSFKRSMNTFVETSAKTSYLSTTKRVPPLSSSKESKQNLFTSAFTDIPTPKTSTKKSWST